MSVENPSFFEGIALNSFTFLFIAFAAVLISRLCSNPRVREVLIFAVSCLFLSSFISTLSQVLILAGFLAIAYAIGKIRSATAVWPATLSFLIVASFWGGLFLLKDPGLLPALNPFSGNPIKVIGISYIVFRGICFVLEIERGEDVRIFAYLNYMVFFPTLLAGPIERYARFEEMHHKPVDWDSTWYNAVNRILNGVIKKFVIADSLSDFGIFSMMAQGGHFSIPILWVGTLSMLFLVYLDFSGYCDIVVGLAALMGFQIVENFRYPFAARNLQEFWARWHVSLTSIIQDYVFSPLSKLVITHVPRSRQLYGIAVVYILSMILVAMWHGTSVGFLIFGLLHGGVLFAIQLRKAKRGRAARGGERPRIRAALDQMATYAFVSSTMIWWFGSLSDAIDTYRRLVGLS
jgi:alginate O-acetyltransferase complex protein AlgI